MASVYSSKDEIVRQIEIDVKSTGLFNKHNFKNPLSKISTIIRAIGNAIYFFIDLKILSVYKAIHPHTALEEDLHEWLSRYGLSWKEAIRARHTLRIGSENLPAANVPIPQGLIVSIPGDENSTVQFQTLASAILSTSTPVDSRGFYTVEVPIECLVAGEIGNVVADSILNIDSPPDGIDLCYNPNNIPLLAGSERESVNDVRNRIAIFENAKDSMFTANWYISESLKYEFVKRCIFVSSKTLGLPGIVKLFLIGSGNTPISPENLQLVMDDFNGEEKNPGGSANVIASNANIQSIDRDIQVFFVDSESILPDLQLYEIIEQYFASLGEGDDFIESDLRYLFYSLPKVFQVIISPAGDTPIPAGVIAVPGSINLSGLVYTP